MNIFRLIPIGKDYLWGGERLGAEYGKQLGIVPLAETWECSTHPDGQSLVENYRGERVSLVDIIAEHPEYLGTKNLKSKDIPFIVKFIDAKEDLSIQVHPDDQYAQCKEHQNGKTEFWYVLDSAKGSNLVYGFQCPVSVEILKNAVSSGEIGNYLQKIIPHKGDYFFLPAGIVHGIGAGNLIVEVQEKSNVTYRLYDYNRIDSNGKKREIHFEKAMDVLNMQPSDVVVPSTKFKQFYNGYSIEKICDCDYFRIEHMIITDQCCFEMGSDSFCVIVCIDGVGLIINQDEEFEIKKGNSFFLPASMEKCSLLGNMELLRIFA